MRLTNLVKKEDGMEFSAVMNESEVSWLVSFAVNHLISEGILGLDEEEVDLDDINPNRNLN